MKRFILISLLIGLLLSACGFGGPDKFPIPEPDYNSKRPRDFTPFESALSALSPERIAELDGLVLEKTIPDLQALMDSGKLTSEELVTYYLSRIQRFDVDKLNSVMELNPDALEIARALDAERASGSLRGPMHGIPVLVKDNIATGDKMHTTAGAYAMRDWQADRDAFLVQQLRAVGAVILGKANLSEWANYSDPDTPNGFSTLGGQTRHPYGPFDPFGSSSGSAVSVAANFVTVSVGTETQGSLIKPAESNGIVAIKTSRGLVSGDYIIPLVDWMDVPGPMGRTVTDVAILLTAMSGVDEKNPVTADAAELAGVDFTQFAMAGAADGKRVGIFISGEKYAAEDDTTARQVGEILSAQGVEVVEIPAEESPHSPEVTKVLEYGFRDSLNRFLTNLGSEVTIGTLVDVVAINNEDPDNRVPYGQGYVTGSLNTTMTADEYAELMRKNHEAAAASLRQVFDKYNVDAIIAGVQVYAAAGYPAITVPNGLEESGQPVGVTIIGDFLGEPDLIAIAYAYEQAQHGRVEPDLEATLVEIGSVLNK
jgi:amidase